MCTKYDNICIHLMHYMFMHATHAKKYGDITASFDTWHWYDANYNCNSDGS